MTDAVHTVRSDLAVDKKVIGTHVRQCMPVQTAEWITVSLQPQSLATTHTTVWQSGLACTRGTSRFLLQSDQYVRPVDNAASKAAGRVIDNNCQLARELLITPLSTSAHTPTACTSSYTHSVVATAVVHRGVADIQRVSPSPPLCASPTAGATLRVVLSSPWP